MRKINTGDVFKMARLLKNGSVLKTVRMAYEDSRREGADMKKIGMDAIIDILCSCTDAKTEEQIYGILAGICEKKPEDIPCQSLEATLEDIRKIIRENNIANFLNSASGIAEKISG